MVMACFDDDACVSHIRVHFCACAHVLYEHVCARTHVHVTARGGDGRKDERHWQAVCTCGFGSLCPVLYSVTQGVEQSTQDSDGWPLTEFSFHGRHFNTKNSTA